MSRILIVEEQPVTRHALRLMMEADRHEVVGEADNGPDALHQVRLCKPDLMILELSIPRLGGLEVLQRLVAQESPVKVLVLTSQDSEYFAGRCLTAGAAGFVSKQENPQAVSEAVRAISQGHSYFPSHALGSVSAAEEAGKGDLLKGLSVRELSVLQLLARGLSNIAIADQLAISDKTVSTYKVRLMQKLHAKSLVELIDIGRLHGLVEGGKEESESPAAVLDPEQQREFDLLRKMLVSVPYPISLRGMDGRILFCNDAVLALFNKKREEVVGQTWGELGAFSSTEEGRLLEQQLLDAIGRGEPADWDVEFQSADQRRVIHVWVRPYRDAQGTLLGAVGGSVDITQRDEAVRTLRSLNARIESVSRGKSQFLASMGGELQGPLQNILAMIGLALNQQDPARRLEPLTVARSMAENLLHLLDDLNLLSRAEVGRLQLAPEEVDLRALVERQVSMLADSAQTKGLSLETDFSLALQTRVWCDPLRLRQVLNNLLSNALKFTEHGSIRVRLQARGQGEGLVAVRIDVTDTGIGIPLDEQEALFEPFAAPLDGQRVRHGSTGLGLALSRSLVELMDGDLAMLSRPGVGSEFSVSLVLPAAEA
ncbi:ATP-binding protein [Enterobacterales bacterium AE_CKDN230030158-1A_HGKHYDSX7]